ncbi:hypothetical protein [Spirulina sp. 06S082]|uniref:hypothetical protein n=1 Tax=Spirulina sp. 06S082 TaxID=3110248 RepID=UPI002B2213E3|nr:hypothetical protein [Spirulina sp. 06S082]MEA5471086.1 hypothetical protein [Spirulina sp. 06S082]
MRVANFYILGMTLGFICISDITLAFSQPEKRDRHLTEFGIILAETGAKEEASQLFDRALEIAEASEERGDKIEAIAYIANRLAKAGFNDRAEIVFTRALELSKQKTDDNNQKPEEFYSHYYGDLFLRNVLIEMARSPYRDRALAEAKNITSPLARAEVFNEVATGLIADNELESARKLLLEAVGVAKTEKEYLSYEANGSCDNLEYALFAKIADNLSQVAELQSALKLAQGVRGCYAASSLELPFQWYQADAFTSIIENLEEITAIRETWKSSQRISDDFEIVKVWGEIAKKLVKIEEYDFAVSIARRLTDPSRFNADEMGIGGETFLSLQQNLLLDIALAFVEKGEVKQGRRIVQFISKPRQMVLNVFLEIAIAKKNYREGRTEIASEQLLDLVSVIEEERDREDFENNLNLQGEIALALASIGNKESAIQTAQTIKDEYWRSQTLTNIIINFAEQGAIEEALQLVPSIEEEFGQASALIGILGNMTENKQLEEVLKIAENLEAEKDSIKIAIGLQFLKLGDIQRGYHLLHAIQGTNFNSEIIEAASVQLVRRGEIEKALKLVEKIEFPSVEAKILADLGLKIMENP